MPIKPIDRLLFAQGGLCFFCNATLPKTDATVEHLVAAARGGPNGDDNCVACCRAINSLLGSMSLKEKIKAVLSQKGSFKCPNGTTAKAPLSAKPLPTIPPKLPAPANRATSRSAPAVKNNAAVKKPVDPYAALVVNLKSRAKGRPAKLQALTADIKTQKLGRTDAEITGLIEKLKQHGKIVVEGTKVTYKL